MLKYLFFTIIIVFSFSSCLKDPAAEELINIKNEFSITLTQQLSTEGSHFALRTTTLTNQDCADNMINANINLMPNDKLIFNIDNITQGIDCDGDQHSISSTNGIQLPNNYYPISIFLKNSIESTGGVTVSEGSFSISLNEQNGVIIDRSYINRIPNDIMWGSILLLDNSLDANDVLSAFKASIQENISEDHNLITGDYGFFKIGNNLNISGTNNNVALNLNEQVEFVFKINGDLNKLREGILSFKNQQGGIELNIMDWTGNQY